MNPQLCTNHAGRLHEDEARAQQPFEGLEFLNGVVLGMVSPRSFALLLDAVATRVRVALRRLCGGTGVVWLVSVLAIVFW